MKPMQLVFPGYSFLQSDGQKATGDSLWYLKRWVSLSAYPSCVDMLTNESYSTLTRYGVSTEGIKMSNGLKESKI